MPYVPAPHLTASWHTSKPAARGPRGVVVSQARPASEAGLAMLEAGGSAVDAAIAAAFALAAVEPWNSGLGGIGFAIVHPAGEAVAEVVDFGPVSPARLDPAAFRLTGRPGADLFGWPEVEGDANVHGPLSFCVPSAVAGYHAMHARWGRLPIAEVLAPALALARRGLPYDWYAMAKVTQAAATLRQYPETQRIYMPGGLPRPVTNPAGFVALGQFADTLEWLARAGLADFYAGDIGQRIASDVSARGGVLSGADLRSYRVGMGPAAEWSWRGRVLQLATGQTAAPALAAVLAEMEAVAGAVPVSGGERPDAAWYVALARALRRAQAARLGADGSTSHVSVCDAQGGMVALTTTLLSAFGSRVVLPATGVLMNNGVMWFDPLPGRANSLAPGARPLTNMCPLILRADDEPVLALGASGGRRILAAVAQMFAYVTEFGIDPEAAAAMPRIDVSATGTITADRRLPPNVLAALRAEGPLEVVEAVALPDAFAAPNMVWRAGKEWVGVADAVSPWSTALAQA